MTSEFTGERVVPGRVDIDLWNEHVARYAFAARLSRNRRVLDLACGTGYGSMDLAVTAHNVTGIDVAADALAYAMTNFHRSNLRWARASATSLPFGEGSFDLVVAFELIEHLHDWPALLAEARRVLAPGGQFVVSTPNKSFYAETRRNTGPNPFHEHEFEYTEFRDALLDVFPSVSLFVEDHTEGILFRPIPARGGADVRLEATEHAPEDSNFFIAVCAMTTQTGAPTFVYIPRAANLLKERIEHVDRLTEELKTKNEWLQHAQAQHQQLLQLHRDQTADLQKSNAWAKDLDDKLTSAGKRILQLQEEFAAQAAQYDAHLKELNDQVVQQTQWALDTEKRRAETAEELARAVELLDRAERTVEERTNWALEIQRERDALQAEVSKVRASRWVRLGRVIGLGPEIHSI